MEASDQDRFISRFAFLNAIPPIRQYPDFDEQGGGIFLQVGCMRWCWSTISQADADDCAARQAVECAFSPLVPGFPIPTPFSPNRIALYYNQAMTGTYTCPDGNLFSYTVAQNTIAAFSQGQANHIAAGLAKLRARQHHLCISNLDEPICENSFYTKQITASGPNVAVFPAADLWELVSGTLPPGMMLETGFSSDGITFSGVATTIGTYQFRVRCTISPFNTSGAGDFMEKVFTVNVVGISNANPLPDAILGTPYSQQMIADGSTVPGLEIWSITSGSLPPGLSLSVDGLISGTPSGGLQGYAFTVQAQFEVGASAALCSKQYMIETSVSLPTPTEYWSFDADTYVGNIVGLALTNSDTIFAAAKNGDGVQFNDTIATTAFIRRLNEPQLNFIGDNFVASVWFKELIKPVGLVASHTLFQIDLEDGGGTFQGFVAVRILPGDLIRLQVQDASFSNNIVDTAYDPGLTDFHLMVVSYSRVTGLAELHIDNVLLATSSAPKFIGSSTQADQLSLARTNAVPTAGRFIADELSVWLNNVSFVQAQRDLLWNSGAGKFWPF